MLLPLTLSLLFAVPTAPAVQEVVQEGPPSRALLHELCRHPRMAGTLTSKRATDMVARVLRDAGWEVTFDHREVLLSMPNRLALKAFPEISATVPLVSRLWTYDPDAIPASAVPPFNSWSASGLVKGPLVDVGYGMRADFERLAKEEIPLRGSIALARYGKGYRGNKLALAEEYGCAGLLLFSEPSDDGNRKGKTWPQGPWKPGWEAQRGSVKSMSQTPGDPSTPGFPSPPPGRGVAEGKARLSDFALAQALPKIPCLPIGSADAQTLIGSLALHRTKDSKGQTRSLPIGPGPIVVEIEVDAPRELRPITNIIAKLGGTKPGAVMAGNHRDAWVRGAHDAGSGTVSLLRAAQILSEKKRTGWKPEASLFLGFWDAEEHGLIGSTEWVEENEGVLSQGLHMYINADAVVSGLRFRASGTPGLEGFVAKTLDAMDLPRGYTGPRPAWRGNAGEPNKFALPGSGSDFAAFLHHVGLPVLDISFSGNSGGHYHTAYDDIAMMERYLDPGYHGHELAGHTVAALLMEASSLGREALDEVAAAKEMARLAVEAKAWMGPRHGQGIANAFQELAQSLQEIRADQMPGALVPPQIYRSLLRDEGLPQREWYRHVLWSPDLENGYGSQVFPVMRICVDAKSQGALDFEVGRLIKEITALKNAWELVPTRSPRKKTDQERPATQPAGPKR